MRTGSVAMNVSSLTRGQGTVKSVCAAGTQSETHRAAFHLPARRSICASEQISIWVIVPTANGIVIRRGHLARQIRLFLEPSDKSEKLGGVSLELQPVTGSSPDRFDAVMSAARSMTKGTVAQSLADAWMSSGVIWWPCHAERLLRRSLWGDDGLSTRRRAPLKV